MRLRLIWPGRTKEQYARAGIEKYLKLLMPFARTEIIEVKEDKGAATEAALRKEGERLLAKTSSFVLLDERGKQMTSTGLARFIMDSASMDFVLGGAYGVSEEVRARASSVLSLSKMTLPHELARVVFLEQLYRALTIINKRGYHH